MDFARIERELRIKASPDVVYEVVSSPTHLRQWWSDTAELAPVEGADGYVAFGDPDDPAKVVQVRVVTADPPRRFAFRWTHEQGEEPSVENSLLVTFDLEPTDDGTLVRFIETGFREQGWDDARVAAQHGDHSNGWDTFLPRLAELAARTAVTT